GGDELGLSGYPNFNTPRAMIFQLEELGFDLIGMANNHVLDKGVRGIYHALYNWAKTDCVISGINADPEMREIIPILERNGVR
ncbi:MAG: CapA family protein, partial [Bacillota bacterium]|nr:CapA family protein [Bacillota bacterium]